MHLIYLFMYLFISECDLSKGCYSGQILPSSLYWYLSLLPPRWCHIISTVQERKLRPRKIDRWWISSRLLVQAVSSGLPTMLTPSSLLCRSGPWWLTSPLFSPSCCFVASTPVLACKPPSCMCLMSSRFAPCPGQSLCPPPACKLLHCALNFPLSAQRPCVCPSLCVFPPGWSLKRWVQTCNVGLWTFRVGKAGLCSPSLTLCGRLSDPLTVAITNWATWDLSKVIP